MNKREQAEMQALRDQVTFLEAQLPREMEVPGPVTYDEILAKRGKTGMKPVPGWFLNPSCVTDFSWGGVERAVSLGCSTGHFHSRDNPKETTSQGGGQMYRSRLDVLLVARAHAHECFMKRLAEIDKAIAAERKNPSDRK